MTILALRRVAFGVLAFIGLAFPAFAGEIRPYNADALAAAQAAGQPVIIHVTAPWCPTCRAQKPVIQSLVQSEDNADLLVFEVDFDSQKDVLQTYGVRQQSTLIAYRGGSEVGRIVGVTDPGALADFVAETH